MNVQTDEAILIKVQDSWNLAEHKEEIPHVSVFSSTKGRALLYHDKVGVLYYFFNKKIDQYSTITNTLR